MRKRHTPEVVYIVESYSSEIDSFEGKDLNEALENTVYYRIKGKEDFLKVKDAILSDFESRSGKFNAMPFFYFSFHGSDDGIVFENHESATWGEVIALMNSIHKWILGVPTSTDVKKWDIPRFTAICSVCNSFASVAALAPKIAIPFQSWIAPKGNIQPTQAFEAYRHFFNFARESEMAFDEIVNRINISLDVNLGMVTFFDRGSS